VQRPVRPVTVVVVNEDVEYALKMASVQDQEPVEALRTNGPHEALRDSVRLRSAKRRADDLDPVASEDRVKTTGELLVAVADHEPHRFLTLRKCPRELPGLLCHPLAARSPRGARDDCPAQ
jgi:hypothetical protein